MENTDLKEYFENLRKEVDDFDDDLTPEQRKEVKTIWERYILEMRKMKDKIEGAPDHYKSDKVEVRITNIRK
jgi:hypothetical protein